MADLLFADLRHPRRPRQFKPPINIENFTDEELRNRFRFGRQGIGYITNLIADELRRSTRRNHALPPLQQVLIALRFYASGSFLQVIGDTAGVDKSTVSRVVTNVSNALIAKHSEFITWPTDAEVAEVKNSFYRRGGFPCVIGCVDGTHIRIQAPNEHENAYVNRKGFHSINVQGVCNHEGKFTNIVARWPGSCHDSHIFRSSNICQFLEENHNSLDDGIVLGDSGYACSPFLMTPYANPEIPQQEAYNSAHTKTWVVIEQTYGRWKRRFHVLHSEIRMAPEKVCLIIGACAVLHNIAVLLNEPMDDADLPDEVPEVEVYDGPQQGLTIRNHICNTFFG
ncbi:putative nuclease HARBI1 [Montipora foliosa]|uniref:putative nuclease HARBI1 n=1 Tax=Montipora foliosa TaxID=591990 RepID=UPI0035F12336